MNPAFAYLQARLEARLDPWLLPEAWQAVEGIGALGPFLEAVRRTPLAPWVAGLSAQSGFHDIEGTLKGGLRRLILEVASWMPGPWRPGVAWLAHLIDLPALARLLEGERAPWMEGDEALRPFLEARPPAGLAPLVRAHREGGSLLEAWKEVWMGRLPAFPASLEALVKAVEDHLRAFPALPVEEAWRAREALGERLRFAFRRSPFQPTAAFAYLGGMALTVERLRGALVGRL